MSRSRRRNPAGGITTAVSDKPGKILSHRAGRRAVRQALGQAGDGDALPHPKQYGSPWCMPKDGKTWYGHGDDSLLRK